MKVNFFSGGSKGVDLISFIFMQFLRKMWPNNRNSLTDESPSVSWKLTKKKKISNKKGKHGRTETQNLDIKRTKILPFLGFYTIVLGNSGPPRSRHGAYCGRPLSPSTIYPTDCLSSYPLTLSLIVLCDGGELCNISLSCSTFF